MVEVFGGDGELCVWNGELCVRDGGGVCKG